jgi:DNA-binding response OmpR family regulator
MTTDKDPSQAGEPAGHANPPHRILVVDDEPSIRLLITNSLARAGYRVDAAADGALAWEALQVRRYDLLITDNAMPKITGIALVKKLRNSSSTLPVVMATGAIPHELEHHPSLGISNILLKPFTVEQILTTVKEVLCKAGSTGPASMDPQFSGQH